MGKHKPVKLGTPVPGTRYYLDANNMVITEKERKHMVKNGREK